MTAGPSGTSSGSRKSGADGTQVACDVCGVDLSNLVQIKCAQCEDYDLCVPCFSKGLKTRDHEPWHDYQVIDQHSYPIFTADWGADEELLLVEGCEQFGLGSWQDIAEHIGGRTREEVAAHYNAVYLQAATYPVPDLTLKFNVSPHEFIEERRVRLEKFRHDQANQPPIKPRVLASVPACHDIQGFMPGRLEFETEAENDAEVSVKDMVFEPEDTELDVEQKLTVLEIYNSRLGRRVERKRVIFAHDLVDYRKLIAADKKRTKEDRDLYNKLKPYVRVLPRQEFDEFCENMLAEQQYRRRIAELQEYRQNGIKSMSVAAKYERDKLARNSVVNRPPSLPPTGRHSMTPEEGSTTIKIRKSGGNPLDITQAPDVDLLSPQERSLCSQLRIMPRSYMALKEYVFEELLKHGGSMKKKDLKETLSSIDEHKVGRVYDFFQSQNWIS